MNRWQGEERLQLEIVALRKHYPSIALHRAGQRYTCAPSQSEGFTITNHAGESLVVERGGNGQWHCDDQRASHAYVSALIEEATIGLGLQP